VTEPESEPLVCCDLDGVVWRGADPIPGSADAIAEMRAAGLHVVFLTNNSSGRVVDNVARLADAGVATDPGDIMSSAQSAAALLARELPSGRVLTCAGPGVEEALTARGFTVVAGGDGAKVDAVVVGWHRDFDFERMRRAADGVRAGARFVATNRDPTYPSENGLLPGAGAIVAAVETAGGRAPITAGKPEAAMAALVAERFGQPAVMIGDRPSTDGDFATRLGCPFALVLSGVVGTPGEEAVPEPAPPFVAPDLATLAPELIAAFVPPPALRAPGTVSGP
jgi:glycerol-1-phosphatase